MRSLSALLAALLACAAPAPAALTIDINYVAPVSPTIQAAFDNAASTWEGLLVGYQDGRIQAVSSGSTYAGVPVNTVINTVYIDALIEPIDGPSGVLGSAGPTEVVLDATGFVLASDGQMRFDDADVANQITAGTFEDLILHEMAHVLGFGTLWNNNNVNDGQIVNGQYINGSGEYTGASATAAWQSEFGQTGTPDIEQGGGPGTADGHWDEVDGGGALTGITDAAGNDLRDELMTGWFDTPSFISQMTVNSFYDIGFQGSTLAAIPEPSSFLALGLVFTAGLSRGRRR